MEKSKAILDGEITRKLEADKHAHKHNTKAPPMTSLPGSNP